MPRPYDRCVEHVRAKGTTTNPYAVCRATMGTDRQIRAREHKRTLRRGRSRA
jgi:hypothetical protein